MERPEIVIDEHLEYLDILRESGATNMWGARSYLLDEFPGLTEQEAGQVLGYWMKSFIERHPAPAPSTAAVTAARTERPQ